jgi:hypothetical protein
LRVYIGGAYHQTTNTFVTEKIDSKGIRHFWLSNLSFVNGGVSTHATLFCSGGLFYPYKLHSKGLENVNIFRIYV